MVDRRQFIKAAGAAGVTGMAGLSGCMGGGGGTTVSILTWTGYDAVNDQVEEALDGVELEISIADGSANMFSTVNAGGGEQYDIVIPNNEYVPRFIEADLAAPVDMDVITNFDALYPTFQSAAEGQFSDGEEVYGMPLQFGWYAYGYDTSVLPEDHEHSYDVLFSEEYEGVDLTGSIALYDGYYKSIMATGLALGYTEAFEGDTVSFTDEQLTTIEETLTDFKPNLLGFVHDEETLTQDYQNGNIAVSFANRSTHVGIMNDVDSVEFSQPKEEELTWFEGAVVTAGSSNKEAAFQVLNEYIAPETGAALSENRNIMNTSQDAMDNIETQSLQIEPDVLEGMIPFKPAERDEEWIEMFERVKNA